MDKHMHGGILGDLGTYLYKVSPESNIALDGCYTDFDGTFERLCKYLIMNKRDMPKLIVHACPKNTLKTLLWSFASSMGGFECLRVPEDQVISMTLPDFMLHVRWVSLRTDFVCIAGKVRIKHDHIPFHGYPIAINTMYVINKKAYVEVQGPHGIGDGKTVFSVRQLEAMSPICKRVQKTSWWSRFKEAWRQSCEDAA